MKDNNIINLASKDIAYANGKYFELGEQVGKFGYSVQKKKK